MFLLLLPILFLFAIIGIVSVLRSNDASDTYQSPPKDDDFDYREYRSYEYSSNASRYSGTSIKTTVRASSYGRNYASWETPHADAVNEKYRLMLEKHRKLEEEIRKPLGVLSGQKKESYFTPHAEQVIEFCRQDIALAEQYRAYSDELTKAEIADRSRHYDKSRKYLAFYKLAVILEKRGEYLEALSICDRAIALGFIDEEGGNSIYHRRNRLRQKLNLPVSEADKAAELPPISLSEITFSAFKKQLANSGFVSIDFETTGLDSQYDRIVEIAAIYYDSGCAEQERFVTLVNPGISIPERASKINHITNSMVANAPKENIALPQLVEFLARHNAPMVAHKASFDMGFLSAALSRQNLSLRLNYADTLRYSRSTFSELNNHKLGTVCEHIGYYHSAYHRAAGDAQGVAAIVRNSICT